MKYRIAWLLYGLAGFCISGQATAQENPIGADLAHRYGCFQCHGAVPQHGALTFPQIAHRYAGQIGRNPDLVSRLANRVQSGPSHGGSPAMPAFRHVSKGDLQVIVRWILSQQ